MSNFTINYTQTDSVLNVTFQTQAAPDLEATFETQFVPVLVGELLPPVVTPSGSNTDPTSPDFDYLALGRLTTTESNALVMSVEETEFIVSGIDYSDNFLSGDLLTPITGLMDGRVTLTDLPERLVNGIIIGNNFTWRQKYRGVFITVATGFITENPQVTIDSAGLRSTVLRLGGELGLLAAQENLRRALYCGEPPETVGEAATIYLNAVGLPGRIVPTAGAIPERINSFINESPQQFLQGIYAPFDMDVREDASGTLEIARRPPFRNPVSIDYTQVLEVQTDTGTFTPASTISVFNRFNRFDGYPETTREYRTFSTGYDETDTSPWFLNGSTYTDVVETVVGETVVNRLETRFGYIPNDSIIYRADVNDDRCADNSNIPTTFGQIDVRETIHDFVTLPHGDRIIWRITTRTDGNYVFEGQNDRGSGPEDAYFIRSGMVDRSEQTDIISEQLDNSICKRDLIWLATGRREAVYGRDREDNFRLLSERVQTFVTGSSPVPTNPVGDLSVSPQIWTRTTLEGAWDDERLRWVEVSVPVETSNPSTVTYVQPKVVSVTVSGEVENERLQLLYGDRRRKTEQAPFCYTINRCEVYASRLLRDTGGLHNARTIVVPFHLNLPLGSSVKLVERFREFDGIVYASENNQTLHEATKTVTLIENVDPST